MTDRRYEALLALDTRGKEDSARDTIERIEKLFAAEGATVEQVQRLERRDLAYPHNHQTSAYFINVIFSASPPVLESLRAKLKLDADASLQNYVRLPKEKPAPAPPGA